ncbi:iron-containing alcohol dehydrogenase [Aquifex aeolicus]|uniref:1,3 propanediol dehydrogenase n=1 Tax=Aquifex aeolicus (strain VF5) TaxID=224324 RepID=O67218_AQUAE|nr:iron-containing alcohol dehydrogenase [Aquifex aeolicus]AAC07174.1 1,3 propanediol dehydrogenase [Aquifex aeolicus VF5]
MTVVNEYRPVEVFFGEGAVKKAGEVGRRFGFKALIVTGRKSTKESGALDKLINSLKQNQIEYVVFDEITPNPTDKQVNKGAEIAVNEKVDFIVGIGGGSVLDAAKAISIVSSNEGYAWDYVRYPEGSRLIPFLNRPVITIPTTAGTGSEVNRYSVLTNPMTKEKMVISHSLNYPKVALVDPELTYSMPPRLTALTGFDALMHALESLTNKRENFIAEEYSVKAIELIRKWLPVAFEEPENKEARRYMSYAAMLAGIAIDHLGVALIHAMEHPVSGHYPEVAHAEGLSALAPYITAFNYRGNPEKYALFARLMGEEEKPHKAVDALVKFIERFSLPKTLKELGVEKEKLPRLAEDVYMCARHSFAVNPVEVGMEEVEELYERAYEGRL